MKEMLCRQIRTCCFLPDDSGRRHSLRLTVQGDVAVSFDADVDGFYEPSRRYCNNAS